MKNRKLFAILTLVAFMMTLLPMAAFALPSRFASLVTTDKSTADADGEAYVKFTVYTYNESNAAEGSQVYIASKRGGTDKFYLDSSFTKPLTTHGVVGSVNDVYYVNSDTNTGKAEFYVASTVSGTTKVAVGLSQPTDNASTDNIYNYLIGLSNTTDASVKLISTKDITFASGSTNKIDPMALSSNATVTGLNLDDKSTATASIWNVSKTSGGEFAKANGSEYYELTFKVKATGGAPVKDTEVQFSVSDTGLQLNKTTATTDEAGTVKVRVSATKAFNGYSDFVRAKAGDKESKVYVDFKTAGAFDIQLIEGGNEKVAKGQDYTLKFKLFDVNGNKISAPYTTDTEATTVHTDNYITFEATTKPTDVKLAEKIYNETGNITVKKNAEGLFVATIKGGKLDKEGDYVIKASLTNGKAVSVPFTVKKQGTLTKMALSYDSMSIPLNGVSSEATVKYYDAENIVKKVAGSAGFSSVIFSASPAHRVTHVSSNTGEVTFTNDKAYSGDVTVTAVDTTENLSATAQLVLTKALAGFNVMDIPAVTPVGSAAQVKVQFVDADGNPTALGYGSNVVLDQKTVVSKPANAIVKVGGESNYVANLKDKGTAIVEVKSDLPGDVTTTIVFKRGTDEYYAATFTVKFGEVKAPVSYGAKNVTMFMGSVGYVADGAAKTMDQSPFIQDGRTFVPVRMVGEALGAEVEFDAATQVITLTRADMTITMTVGSNVLTKSDGTNVVADVAPFIVAETGRTVIPFRAIAEAFGATVEAVFAADGTVNAVTFQQ